MEPALKDLQDLAEAFGPALQGVLEQVEDWSAYAPLEMLDNGDIIIRRKHPAPPLPDDVPEHIDI